MPEQITFISTIPEQNLLIFYGFGITLLALAVQIKLNVVINKDKLHDIQLANHMGLYKFVKVIFNWSVSYFFCAIFLLISSLFSKDSLIFRPLFYNISVILSITATIFITLQYVFLVLFEMVSNWNTARHFDI